MTIGRLGAEENAWASGISTPMGFLRALIVVVLSTFAAPVCGCGTSSEGPRETVRLLELDGIVTPVMERHLVRELEAAAEADARVVVIRIDTPGGLVDPTRGIVAAILSSPVPVVVWVAPPGAHAASAGMFVTIAAHVAAMAPGTNIGAAHPVTLGDAGQEQEAGKTMETKVVNDAAAFARSVADARGRNAEWADRAVRESESVTADEALELGVVDLLAEDLPALLADLHGRKVSTIAGDVRLVTEGIAVTERQMSFPERVVQALANPNVAFVLLTLGIVGLIAELYSPGTWIPGSIGAVSLVLAFAALGSLPVNWAGVVLLLLAALLLVGELATEGMGILGAAALASFVLGSLFLYSPLGPVPPELPDVRVSPWLIALVAGGAALFFLVVLRAVARTRGVPVGAGPETLVGRAAIARTDLRPAGVVEVEREQWSAVSTSGDVPAGHAVRIKSVEGVQLHVEEISPEARS
mgnify:CR=1 FL=1